MSTETPLTENADVIELLGILRQNDIDASDLRAVIGSVAAMERQLSAAVTELSAMRRDLSDMREERNHPVRTALEKEMKSLSEKIKGIRAKLKAVKDGIVSGCRWAVAAFKDTGVSALNNLVGFFEIKPELESLRDSINDGIKSNQASIAKIEKVSEEYHSAGRHLMNVGRAIRGRDLIPDIKPNGKLARLIETPFRAELRSLTGSLRNVNKALAGLDRLEKAAARRAEQNRPSTLATMKDLREKVAQQKKDAPAQEKSKQNEAAI